MSWPTKTLIIPEPSRHINPEDRDFPFFHAFPQKFGIEHCHPRKGRLKPYRFTNHLRSSMPFSRMDVIDVVTCTTNVLTPMITAGKPTLRGLGSNSCSGDGRIPCKKVSCQSVRTCSRRRGGRGRSKDEERYLKNVLHCSAVEDCRKVCPASSYETDHL